jgi:ERCC4-related helicase
VLLLLLQVDLIICWDASSPSRMRQREGRTGRSRPGRVVYLLSEGREQQHYEDNHAKEQLVKVGGCCAVSTCDISCKQAILRSICLGVAAAASQ